MQGKPVPDVSLPSTGGSIFTLSHLKFPFELLPGADEALCRQFGVIKQKTVPGHVQEVSNFAQAL